MLHNQLNGQGCYVLLEVYDVHVFIKKCYSCDNINCHIVKTLASPFDYASYLCFLAFLDWEKQYMMCKTRVVKMLMLQTQNVTLVTFQCFINNLIPT